MSLLRRLFGRPTATPHAAALARAQQGVAIYWRPGCPYCSALTAAVRRHQDHAAWVNIHRDPEAAAYVRSVNQGDETVPTVVIDGVAHTNPPPGMVRQALARIAAAEDANVPPS
ncbi:glutaredoxin family protein [Nocardioides sp.]|uniref:glutaredoxin family protein n=1 Tax=Nocardioides sp. TaxID=35761 RepID=UPI00356463EA